MNIHLNTKPCLLTTGCLLSSVLYLFPWKLTKTEWDCNDDAFDDQRPIKECGYMTLTLDPICKDSDDGNFTVHLFDEQGGDACVKYAVIKYDNHIPPRPKSSEAKFFVQKNWKIQLEDPADSDRHGPSGKVKFLPGTPMADFDISKMGLTIMFVNKTTGAPATIHSWDFGDLMGTSTDVTPMPYTYMMPGTYEVKLIETNDCGSSDPKKKTITVP